jgi:hypothetical protein
MLFIFAMEVWQCIVQLALLIDSFAGGGTAARIDDWLNADLAPLVDALLITFAIFSAVSVILVGQLIVFHLRLQHEKISTYEFIVRDHSQRREQQKLEDELASQRIVALAEAYREKKKWRYLRLRMGGCCRTSGWACCDPMDLPKPPKEPDPEDGFAAALGSPLGSPDVLEEIEEQRSDDTSPEKAKDVSNFGCTISQPQNSKSVDPASLSSQPFNGKWAGEEQNEVATIDITDDDTTVAQIPAGKEMNA